MPLMRGSSNSVVSQNVKTLMGEGRKQSQAVAIALSEAGRSTKGTKNAHKRKKKK